MELVDGQALLIPRASAAVLQCCFERPTGGTLRHNLRRSGELGLGCLRPQHGQVKVAEGGVGFGQWLRCPRHDTRADVGLRLQAAAQGCAIEVERRLQGEFSQCALGCGMKGQGQWLSAVRQRRLQHARQAGV